MEACGRVFVSYRRTLAWRMAHLIRKCLTHEGYDVFMDVTELTCGRFENRIIGEIRHREHFLVVLEPGSLDDCSVSTDWFRREIAEAIAHGCNVVPVLIDSFTFPDRLPADIAELTSFHGVRVVPEYVDEAMGQLGARYLPWRPPMVADGPVMSPIYLTVGSHDLPTGPVEITAGSAELSAWLLDRRDPPAESGTSAVPAFAGVMNGFSMDAARGLHSRWRPLRR